MYVQVHGTGNMGQGFFAPNSWLEEYYTKHNLFDKESKGSATNTPAEVVEELDDTMKKANKEFTEYWDSEMEELHEAGD